MTDEAKTGRVLVTLKQREDGSLGVVMETVGTDAGWAVEELAALLYNENNTDIENVTVRTDFGDVVIGDEG